MLALVAAACAVPARQPAGPGIPREHVSYLVSPLTGYPLSLDPAAAAEIRASHQAFVEGGERTAALATAAALLERTPDLHPAVVLAAQVELAEGRPAEAARLLAPVTEALPAYTAAQLSFGRAAELLGDLAGAYAAFRTAADRHALAARRAAELRQRAIEIVHNRVLDALQRGHTEAAAAELRRLQEWGPAEELALDAQRRVAATTGDAEAELQATRALSQLHPGDPELLERRAVLEVETGDLSAGLQILQELAAADPGDSRLQRELQRARFRWRLQLVPQEVGALARRGELTRADLAALLYWVVPEVRHGRGASARIATDILEDPFRQEIARVVNLGLMEVDPNLHAFAPRRAATRGELLRGLIALLAQRKPPAACVGALAGVGRPSREGVCQAAVSCGLVPEEGACLPGSPVAGREAIELIRRALVHLDA